VNLWKHASAYLLGALAVFAPIRQMLVAMVFIVMADLVTGLWAAARRGERIRSDKLRATVVKLAVYLLALCIGFVAEVYLLDRVIPVAKMIAGLAGAVELKSVLENLDSISGGSLFKSLIARLAPENAAKNGGAVG
jgi:FtsH-binding integral membrane protein